MMIKWLDLEKKKEKHKKLMAKVKLNRSFLVWCSRNIASVITFRIDSCTIKRGSLIRQLDHLVPLGVEILALPFRPSAHLVRSD